MQFNAIKNNILLRLCNPAAHKKPGSPTGEPGCDYLQLSMWYIDARIPDAMP